MVVRLSLITVVAGLLVGGCAGTTPPADTLGTSRYVSAPLPQGPIGYYVEGALAREAGDDERALALLREAARRDDNLILVNQVLGEIYREQGELSLAEQFFRRLVNRDPNTAGGYFQLGEVLELSRQFGEAINSYLQGLAIEPNNAQGNLGAGRALLAVEQPEQAVDYLQRAASLNPDSGEAWANLGRALGLTGDFSEAETAYARAIEALPADDPSFRDLLIAQGLNYIRQGRGQDAIVPLERANQIEADATSLKFLGDAYLSVAEARRALGERGEAINAYEQAVEWYEAAIAEDPSQPVALNARGSAFYRQWELGGRLEADLREAALDSWRQSLEIDPNQPRVQEAIDRFDEAGVLGPNP